MRIEASADRRETLRMLRHVEAFAVDGATVDEMTAGCELFDVLDAGQLVGAFALDFVGAEVTITAMYREGVAGREELAQVEAIARDRGARVARMVTRRPGLVRNLSTRYGYSLAVAELRKAL
jgi:hypothetical protein